MPDPAALPDASAVRLIMSRHLGVMRDATGLRQAIDSLLPLIRGDHAAADPALVGVMIAVAALRREESRGGHYRTDFPLPSAIAQRTTLQLDDALLSARAIAETPWPDLRSAR
jgi:L-aspartate oxidase